MVPKLSADDIAVYYGAEEAKFSVVPGVTHPYTPGSLQPGEYAPEKAAKTALRMKAVSEQVRMLRLVVWFGLLAPYHVQCFDCLGR